jgi:hypothetical protein
MLPHRGTRTPSRRGAAGGPSCFRRGSAHSATRSLTAFPSSSNSVRRPCAPARTSHPLRISHWIASPGHRRPRVAQAVAPQQQHESFEDATHRRCGIWGECGRGDLRQLERADHVQEPSRPHRQRGAGQLVHVA